MPDLILPGAIWTPGVNAGYNSGRSRMQFCVDHCTAGVNSHSIGLNGYFHFLVNKEGPPYQYAEPDAVTWHAGPYNSYGPGVEIERMSAGVPTRPGLSGWEELTDDQAHWLAQIWDFLEEWGIPKDHYEGPRFEGDAWHGHINHGDIDDQRSDGITPEEVERITDVGASAEEVAAIVNKAFNDRVDWWQDRDQVVKNTAFIATHVALVHLEKVIAGEAASPEEVQAAVEAELAKINFPVQEP